jgi:FAD/FMN-containing dehydrogenase
MTSMGRVLSVDKKSMTVRVEAGIFWHTLAEELRKDGLDYLSAPLNMTSTVGGVTAVGGVDINSPRLGTSADQVVAIKAVTPTGEIVECSEDENRDLFERILYGYGQFAVMAEATLKIRPFTPMKMRYLYYSSLEKAIEDLRVIVENDASDYSGILTIMDKAINLLVGFDTDEREREFETKYAPKLRGHGDLGFLLRSVLYYALRPWRIGEALYLLERKLRLFPELHRGEFLRDGKIYDRTVLFSRAVWKFWGGRQMVIPDVSATKEKFLDAVVRGNEVCRKYFKYYTLYCVGIKHFGDLPRYELSCMPPGAEGVVYGCEFEPVLRSKSGDFDFSRDHIQSFKNEIYDIGIEAGLGYYRFGGMMKGYIRRAYGDDVVDRQLEAKRKADPAMILNRESVF